MRAVASGLTVMAGWSAMGADWQPGGSVPEGKAYRSSDGSKWDVQGMTVGEGMYGLDLLAITRATPARSGPDAGAVVLYGVREIGKVEGLGLVRQVSPDMGRSFGALEPVVLGGWPKDMEEYAPASLSAVQLGDGRIRLYIAVVRRDVNKKSPDWRLPKPTNPSPEPPEKKEPVPLKPYGGAAPGSASQAQQQQQPGPQRGQKVDHRGTVISAVSTDGLRFSVEDGIRFKADGLSDPEVIEMAGPVGGDKKVVGPWLMFHVRDGRVRLASSADGLVWKAEEAFSWAASQPTATANVEGQAAVRVWAKRSAGGAMGQEEGLASVVFDPAKGEMRDETGVLLKGAGTDPSVVWPGDGSRLLVWNQQPADNGRPGRQRP